MKFMRRRVYCMKPNFKICIGQEHFYKGVYLEIVVWKRGIQFSIASKKSYQEHVDRMNKHSEEMARMKRESN